MFGNVLGPWQSRFIYSLNMQFLIKNLISFSAYNRKITLTLRNAVQTGGYKEMSSILADQ
jgi:hypothetical protein